MRSNDGVVWTSISPIHPTMDVNHLAAEGSQWVAGLYDADFIGGQLYLSYTDGSSWAPVAGWPGTNVGPVRFGY